MAITKAMDTLVVEFTSMVTVHFVGDCGVPMKDTVPKIRREMQGEVVVRCFGRILATFGW